MKLDRKRVLVCLVAVSLVLLAETPASADSHGTTKVYRLGNPATTISTQDTTTAEELKERVRAYAASLQVVLAQSTFDGDPQDFFDAVENGRFEETEVNTGSTFPWMAYRKGGNPALLHNVEWAAKKPFRAWRVTVESKAATFTFIIPGTCLNLALESKTPRPPLVCELRARATASTAERLGTIELTGTVRPAGDLEITGIGGPGKTIDVGRARATGGNRFSFQPDERGTYNFQAVARDRYGREASCSARATVEPPPPPPRPKASCRLNASYDEDAGVITLDASGAEGTVTVTGMDAPEGATGGLEGGDGRWTVTVNKRIKKRGGTYVFRARAEREGDVDACDDVQVVIPERPGFEGRWILRAFGFVGSGADRQDFDTSGPFGLERNSLEVEAGDGVGLALEYLFHRRIGVEGAALFGDGEGELMHDRSDVWAMAEDDISFRAFTLGVNFHLTPDHRADVYIGPFFGFVQHGDARFDPPGRWFDVDFEDEGGLGAQIGLDLPFKAGSRWGFNSALRWLESSAETESFMALSGEEVELNVDPLLFSAGISFRF